MACRRWAAALAAATATTQAPSPGSCWAPLNLLQRLPAAQQTDRIGREGQDESCSNRRGGPALCVRPLPAHRPSAAQWHHSKGLSSAAWRYSQGGAEDSWGTPGKPFFSFHQFPENVPREQLLRVLMGNRGCRCGSQQNVPGRQYGESAKQTCSIAFGRVLPGESYRGLHAYTTSHGQPHCPCQEATKDTRVRKQKGKAFPSAISSIFSMMIPNTMCCCSRSQKSGERRATPFN